MLSNNRLWALIIYIFWVAFNDLHSSRINSKHVRCYYYRFTWNIVHIGQDKLSHIFPCRQIYFYDNFSCYWKMKFMDMYNLKILRCFCHDLYNGSRVKQVNYFTANWYWKSINPNHGNDHLLQISLKTYFLIHNRI